MKLLKLKNPNDITNHVPTKEEYDNYNLFESILKREEMKFEDKSPVEKLSHYNCLSKVQKLAKATKAGYNDIEDYREFLKNKVKDLTAVAVGDVPETKIEESKSKVALIEEMEIEESISPDVRACNISTGDVISETQHYHVKRSNGFSITINDTNNGINKEWIDDVGGFRSANHFDKEVAVTRTEMSDILMSKPGIACGVNYFKVDKEKKPKQLKEESAIWAEELKDAFLAKGVSGIEEYALKPVSTIIKGDERTIRGYHNSKFNAHGRLEFCDVEDGKKWKQVDPRTMQWVIVENVKYVLKK